MDFTGKAVLVTGATSGIGAAIARAFAGVGASVLLTGRDAERGERVAGSILAAGGTVAFGAADITESQTPGNLVQACLDRFGRLDVLVNNAGVIYDGTAEETSDAEWLETMAVNLDGAFRMSRAAIAAIRQAGGGSIVNVASDWALVGGRRAVAYCASKGGLMMMTKAMALDHAHENIRINAVCPTEIDTPMLDREIERAGLTREEALASYGDKIPMGRVGTTQDVANAVLFLASDDASFLTGVALPIDGGVTAA
ncbi:MAG: SDR family oxidoreductase [Rhodospirillales bacterium]|nr:MAG: SDR family oxidoreductase [Rhodospirillales bacterium]